MTVSTIIITKDDQLMTIADKTVGLVFSPKKDIVNNIAMELTVSNCDGMDETWYLSLEQVRELRDFLSKYATKERR